MRPLHRLSIAALITGALSSACGRELPTTVQAEKPNGVETSGSSPEISDAVHSSGSSSFYFLPPIVRSPAFTGTFDSDLSPEVTICRLGATGCQGSPLAQFTPMTGPGSETVRVDATAEHYIVNWNTNAFPIDEGATYRISVVLGPATLGYADVQMFPTAKEAKNVSNEYVALVDGRTLPIKFRIEQGIAVSIEVQPNPASVIVGKTVGFTATLRDAHGNVLANQPVTWNSANSATASVDASGVATGVSVGNTFITASSNGLSTSSSLTVIPSPVASVEVTPPTATVIKTKMVQLTAVVKDGDGNVLTGRTVTWASSDPSIATVDSDGLVTGVDLGVVTITATCEGKSGSAEVTVIRPPVVRVEIDPNPASVTEGNTVQLNVKMWDADGNELTGRAVSWASSDLTIASVNAAGVVSGLHQGQGTITATSEGVTGDAQVNVVAAGLTLALGSISAGYTSSCGLTADGGAYCWGVERPRPFALNWGFRLTQIAVAMFVKCGLAEDGTAYCQGAYTSGHYPQSTVPTAVPLPAGLKFVHLTDHGGGGPTCGLATDDTAWCWGGWDAYGSQPVQISPTVKFTSIAGGGGEDCGLTANHELWCWGYALWGPLTPTRIMNAHQFKYVTVDGMGCGLDLDSYVWCWGWNTNGEFGNGTTISTGWLQPAVLGANGMRFSSIHAGSGKVCGIALDDGDAYCWGSAYIGDGTANGSLVPRRISSPEPLVEVFPGQHNHVCGITQTGAVYCWGYNVEGQVGDGTFTTPRLTPVRVVPPIP